MNGLMIARKPRTESFSDYTIPTRSYDESDSSSCTEGSVNSLDEQDNFPQNMTESISPSGPDYRHESNRLNSFDNNWPHKHFLLPCKMASAGFFYLGEEDLCRCAFCNVKIGHWEVGDDPWREHQRWADYCPYIRHRPTGNVPITVTNPPLGIPSNSQENLGQDECGIYNLNDVMMPVEIRPNSIPERGEANKQDVLPGAHIMRPPSFPQMGSYDARLNSFKNWPRSMKVKPQGLCEAGFFYSGTGDQTLCFHCGGGLKDWEDNDDPWTEHAKWFSKCPFLLLGKGKYFVDNVQEEYRKQSESTIMATTSTTQTPGETELSENVTSLNIDEEQNIPIDNARDEQQHKNASTSQASAESELSENACSLNVDKLSMYDKGICKICYAEEADVIILPCRHLFACVKCAPTLSLCAICRQPFNATVRVIFA